MEEWHAAGEPGWSLLVACAFSTMDATIHLEVAECHGVAQTGSRCVRSGETPTPMKHGLHGGILDD